MAVYVDDMNAPYGGMIMCHMVADKHAELIAMVKSIGVKEKWIQHEGTANEHFDICLAKKKRALMLGAKEITWREYAGFVNKRCVKFKVPRLQASIIKIDLP